MIVKFPFIEVCGHFQMSGHCLKIPLKNKSYFLIFFITFLKKRYKIRFRDYYTLCVFQSVNNLAVFHGT